ncbi:helix-turn-helix transcriptional regulator [Bacillus sp. S13(2024)]|uniref:helix-turn-helix domain-containing protein n=1 Tax=unclassified Bacillus (in: firmicutes) TaxID=185979 RepID=UPI003D1CCD70
MLGDYIKDSRQNLKISQRELAKQIDTSNTFISNLEKGNINNPNPVLLQRIAQVLDLDYKYILQLAGYLPNELFSNKEIAFKQESLKKWLQNRNEIANVGLDIRINSSIFEAVINHTDDKISILKIITSYLDVSLLIQEIKGYYLDLILNYKDLNVIELHVILAKESMALSEVNILNIKESLEYVPIKTEFLLV